MRFAVISSALFAGAAMAGWAAEEEKPTVYATEVQTITSCAPEVTDCPGEMASYMPKPTKSGGSIVTLTHAIPTETDDNSPVMPPMDGARPSGRPPPPPMNSTSTWAPYPTEEACGDVLIKTITTSYTTVLPTVIYETVDVPCETEVIVPSVGTSSAYTTYSTGYVSPTASVSPEATESAVFTGAASTTSFSIVAVAAGLVAFLA